MANKTIFKIIKKDKFVQIDRKTVNDKRLSWKARGLLVYLLSKPTDWRVYINQLVGASDENGETSLRSGLKELEKHGYIKRVKVRDDEGKIKRWQYLVFETPGLREEIDISTLRFSKSGEPSTTNIDNTNNSDKSELVSDTSQEDFYLNDSSFKQANPTKEDKRDARVNLLLEFLEGELGISEWVDDRKWRRRYAYNVVRDPEKFPQDLIIEATKEMKGWPHPPRTMERIYKEFKIFGNEGENKERFGREGPTIQR